MSELQTGTGRNIAAVGLIGLGLFFLASQIFNFSVFGLLWPFFVILPGAAFLYFALTGGKNTVGLAVPGTVITGTGLILLFQSITGHWASWAYAWTLYPLFVGLALTYMGGRTGDSGTYSAGQGLVKWGGVAFLVAAALFELVIFGGGGFLGGLAAPLLLIGIGAFMLFGRGGRGLNAGKAKRDGSFSRMKAKNDYYPSSAINPDLQRKIDAALAEEDEPEAANGKTVI
jgi:hypothetical protein